MTTQEPDPPDPRLVALAGIRILSRILNKGGTEPDDLLRLAAFVAVLERLRDHLGEP